MNLGLIIKNDKVVVSSKDVAKNYGKEHSRVLKDIRNLVKQVPQAQVNFALGSYNDNNNQDRPLYEMDRQGFSMLVMGFTGKKAKEFTYKYTLAFEEMAKEMKTLSKDSYMIDNPIERAKAWIREEEEREQLRLTNKKQEQVIGELKPKADYTDRILKNKGLVTITQIAKDYGMTGQEMNKLLHQMKIQYKQSDQWLLYRDYQGKGYTHSQTIDIVRSDGSPDIKMNTKWTQKGRLFLYEKLKENNVLPTIEQETFNQVAIMKA